MITATGSRGPGTGELADDLAGSMAALRRVLRRAVRRRVTGPSLPAAEVELLVTVLDQPGLGVGEAARVLSLAPNTVSTLVSRLVERGLIVRRTDPDDGRAARLWTTSTGRARIRRWRDQRAEVLGEALTSLSTADRVALAGAIPALARLTAGLRAADADPLDR